MRTAGKVPSWWDNVWDAVTHPEDVDWSGQDGRRAEATLRKMELADKLHPGYMSSTGKQSAREILEANGYDWKTGKKRPE